MALLYVFIIWKSGERNHLFFCILLLQAPWLEAFIYIMIIDHYNNFEKFNIKTFFCATQYIQKNWKYMLLLKGKCFISRDF